MSQAENDQQDMQQQVQLYQRLVQEYEQFDAAIDTLIMRNGGASKNMSDEDRKQYHELARRRRDLLNEMRLLERDLLDED
jgi:hypothetical protein